MCQHCDCEHVCMPAVGGFSVLNAIAGAMSEDLPLIVISGCVNSNDYAQNRVL